MRPSRPSSAAEASTTRGWLLVAGGAFLAASIAVLIARWRIPGELLSEVARTKRYIHAGFFTAAPALGLCYVGRGRVRTAALLLAWLVFFFWGLSEIYYNAGPS